MGGEADCRDQRGLAPVIRVLFVCTGNLCRSPTAEGVFRALVRDAGLSHRIEADSAGTSVFNEGAAPDARARDAARGRGVDLGSQCARRIRKDDFHRFDYLVALDASHRRRLIALCPEDQRHRIRLLLDFAPNTRLSDVPDPYDGGPGGFGRVFDLISAGAAGLLAEIRTRQG